MIRQYVYLPRGWRAYILYDARPSNATEIADRLFDLGCSEKNIRRASQMIDSGVPNEGLTYSNPYERKSLIVVGHVTSPLELANTLLHEVDHLQIAICKADGLRTDGEDAAYLIGDITESIARNAWLTMKKLFLYLI